MQLSQLISARTIPGLFCPHPTPPTPPFAPRTAPALRTPPPPPRSPHTHWGLFFTLSLSAFGGSRSNRISTVHDAGGRSIATHDEGGITAHSECEFISVSFVFAVRSLLPSGQLCITEVDFLLFLVLVFVDAKTPTWSVIFQKIKTSRKGIESPRMRSARQRLTLWKK